MKNINNIILLLFLSFIFNKAQSQCWKSLSGGYSHSAGVQEDGTLWTWGNNESGQLGNGTTINLSFPTKVGVDNNWVKVKCGGSFTMALKTDGTLWSFGKNDDGQLGIGGTSTTLIPTLVGNSNNWVDFDVNFYAAFGLKSDGTLWSWGFGPAGAMGDGTNLSRSIPGLVNTETNWESISAGGYHVFGIRNQGGLETWGSNTRGELGDGTTINKNTPTYISTNTWYNLTGGRDFSVGLIMVGAQESSLWAWGYNALGQLGNGTNTNLLIPTQIGVETDWSMLSCGYSSTYAIKSNGTLWAWGYNSSGQLGVGSTISKSIPTQVGNNSDWKAIFDTKGDHMFGLKTDGSLWAWGKNYTGSLGDGTENDSYVPKLIMACNPSGIENNQSSQFSIYPNPVKDILNIQKQTDLIIDEFYISDVNGKQIGNSYPNLEKINVQHLANGVYILNILNQNQISHLKFIKQ